MKYFRTKFEKNYKFDIYIQQVHQRANEEEGDVMNN